MKKRFLPITVIIILFIVSIAAADSEPVNFSNTGTNSCSVTIDQNLAFTIANAIYDAGPLAGQMELNIDFQFFGEQNGQLLWQLGNVDTSPPSASCSLSIASDLSFTLTDAVYDAGPLVGQTTLQADFQYFGEQNGALLWILSDVQVDNTPSDPTPNPPTTNCGAYVAPGVWKDFDCYNLAAIGKTTGDDPFTPSWRLIGGYWQWGRKGPDLSQWYDTNTEHFAHGPNGPGISEANESSINGWNTNYASNGAWSETQKTANDPCPGGYRVPTIDEWNNILANNIEEFPGSSWSSSPTNYSSGLKLGNSLFLPAAGYRSTNYGKLSQRGNHGYYWSSTVTTNSKAWASDFYSSVIDTDNRTHSYGFSVRCITE